MRLPWHSGNKPMLDLHSQVYGAVRDNIEDDDLRAELVLAFLDDFCRLAGLKNPKRGLLTLLFRRLVGLRDKFDTPIEYGMELLAELNDAWLRLERECNAVERSHLEALLIANSIDPASVSLDMAKTIEVILHHRGELTHSRMHALIEKYERTKKASEGVDAGEWIMNMSDEQAEKMLSDELKARRVEMIMARDGGDDVS